MEKKIAVYPGTFDPVTNGHIDIVKRACRVFDEVVVGIVKKPHKTPVFSIDKRRQMLQEVLKDTKDVSVKDFDGLLVEFVLEVGAKIIIKGLRAVSDFEYELQMALMNRNLQPEIETVFMMPQEEYIYLSSSIVKEIASLGGNLKGLIPSFVERELKSRFGQD